MSKQFPFDSALIGSVRGTKAAICGIELRTILPILVFIVSLTARLILSNGIEAIYILRMLSILLQVKKTSVWREQYFVRAIIPSMFQNFTSKYT